MATSITTAGTVTTITVVIPLPTVGLPAISLSFPPRIPNVKIPLVPEALLAVAVALAKLQAIINKLLMLIPGNSIRLIVKLGPTTIIDQTLSTADAIAAAVALTLCKK
jgi:hypothetical protein